MTYSLDLKFRKPSKGELPGPANAWIYVKSYGRDNKGHLFITPSCVTCKEIEYQVKRLKKELDTIEKDAKQKFLKNKKSA